MNRKHNATVSLAALVLLATILALCIGCTTAKEEAPGRFTYEREFLGDGRWQTIITDTDTGAEYLFYSDRGGAGLTKLED